MDLGRSPTVETKKRFGSARRAPRRVRRVPITMSVLPPIIDSLPATESPEGDVLSEPFLATCRRVLPVFDRLGVAFSPAKSDVSGNIERLAKRAGSHPKLFDICLEEVATGTQASNSGCCKGLLWLKRFLEFTMDLLRSLEEAPRTRPMKDCANDAYARRLKPYHGWISSGAFSVVMSFPPSRTDFVNSLGGEGAYADIKAVVDGFTPVLAKIHQFLVENALDDPTKV